MEYVYGPVIAAVRTMFKVQGLRFRITGEQYVPRRGGAVMAINHTGYLEFTYAGLAAVPARRYVRFMAKEAVFRHKVSGPLMRGMKHISVDREAGADSYAAAVAALRAGEIVGVFPEATISRSFELKTFKLGAARMAAEAGVPILPVVVWGSQRVWTKGHPKRLGRHKFPIYVEVAPPIPVPADADPVAVTAQLKETMSVILERLRSEYPPLPDSERHLVPARMGGSAPTLEEAAVIEQAEASQRAQLRAQRLGQPAPGDPGSA